MSKPSKEQKELYELAKSKQLLEKHNILNRSTKKKIEKKMVVKQNEIKGIVKKTMFVMIFAFFAMVFYKIFGRKN